jgi:hypothetical protein
MNSVEKRALAGLITRRFERLESELHAARRAYSEKVTEQIQDGTKEMRAAWSAQITALIEDAAQVGIVFMVHHYELAPKTEAGTYNIRPKVVDANLSEYAMQEVNAAFPPVNLPEQRDELLEELFIADISVAAKAILDRIPTVEQLRGA